MRYKLDSKVLEGQTLNRQEQSGAEKVYRFMVTPQSKMIGTPEQCVEKINKYVDICVICFMLTFPVTMYLKCLGLFREKVMPQFRT